MPMMKGAAADFMVGWSPADTSSGCSPDLLQIEGNHKDVDDVTVGARWSDR
jgi:hypothetical protein